MRKNRMQITEELIAERLIKLDESFTPDELRSNRELRLSVFLARKRLFEALERIK